MNIDAVVFLALSISILLLAFKIQYMDAKLSALIFIHRKDQKKGEKDDEVSIQNSDNTEQCKF